MNGIEEKLLAVITESLPSAHVGVLKDYLNKAAKNEKEIEELKSQRDRYEKSSNEKSSEIDILKKRVEAVAAHNALLAANEDRVKEERRVLDLTLAKKDIAALQQQLGSIMEFNRVVFRNPKFVHQENTTSYVQDKKDSYGNMLHGRFESDSKSTIVSSEQE